MSAFRITVLPEELDLERCLFSGQVFRWRRSEGAYEGVDGHLWWRIRRDGDRLDVEGNGQVADFRRLFNLERTTAQIGAEIVAAEPRLAPYLSALPGLRIMQPGDPVEVFYSFLCTANNHLKRIMPMVARLADFGPPFSETGLRRFPTSGVIAALPEQVLREAGFGYRAATITYAARVVEERGGDNWICGLREVGYARAHEELIAIKGIGHKLADCICLYGLHYGEAVPIDTHMWQAATRLFFPHHAGKPLTDLRYREVGDLMRARFGALAGWAHLFLYYENLVKWRTRI